MNSWAKDRKQLRIALLFLFCLFTIPVLAWAQDTNNKKNQAKQAPTAPPPAKSTPPPAQPQIVRTPAPSPPAQSQGRGPVTSPRGPNTPGPEARKDAAPPVRSFSPPSGANRVPKPDGTAIITHPDGRKWEVNNAGQATRFSKPGMDARLGHDGRATFVKDDKRGVTITRAPNGVRQVVSARPDGARVVSYGMNRGYVEREARGRPGYVQRTYVMGGRQYVTVYRTYSYNGIVYQRYVPAVYYQQRFYVWAATPWAAPVSYGWGWNAEPWYGYYPGYFTPAPVYSNPALLLTDFLLAANLKLAYENQQSVQAPPPQQEAQSAPLSPAVKLAIAEEVRQQIAAEQAASTQPAAQPTSGGGTSPVAPPPALDPAQKVFVISSNLDVPTAGGAMCPLTPGDIIIRTDDRIGAGNTVGVTVLSSKAGDCPSNAATSIEVAALQDMHNEFRQQIDSGLGMLANNQGAGGIPSSPPAGAFNSGIGQRQADVNSEASLIQQQQQSANQAELEVRVASAGGQ